jgi:hypothetical protein
MPEIVWTIWPMRSDFDVGCAIEFDTAAEATRSERRCRRRSGGVDGLAGELTGVAG